MAYIDILRQIETWKIVKAHMCIQVALFSVAILIFILGIQSEVQVQPLETSVYPVMHFEWTATKYYYWILLIASGVWPIIALFVPGFYFGKMFFRALPPIVLIAICYISWDIYFTELGIWGFNERYYLGYTSMGLPIEECLFFIIIPTACLLLYYSVIFFRIRPLLFFVWVEDIFIIALILVGFFYFDRIYTACAISVAIISYAFLRLTQLPSGTYFLSFLITLIPMFLINEGLTGSFSLEPVVLYNQSEIIGIRLGTMPLEDLIYQYGLFGMIITLVEKNQKK